MSISNVVQHRASIGLFYSRARRMPKSKRVLISSSLIIPYMFLYSFGFKAINLAFTIFTFMELVNSDIEPSKTKKKTTQPIRARLLDIISDQKTESLVTLFCIILLILAGDIELNPGPQQSTTSHELSIIHTNIGSLRNKIDELSIEASKLNLDVVTVSETWLNETIDNKDIALSGFSPPIRLDRHGHGGVAILFKIRYDM